MARQERPKEDLLRDATALVERVELRVEGFPEHVIVGFRADGAASFFFGEDPVFHFNAQHELRRAFRNDRLIKASHGELVALERHRQDGQVQLVRHDLDRAEKAEWIERARKALLTIRESMAASRVTVVAQVPSDVDLLPRIQATIASIAADFRIARRPNV